MVVQIALSVLAFFFVVFVFFLVSFLLKIKKDICVIRDDFHLFTEKACSLIGKLEELSESVKQKSQSLSAIPQLLSSFSNFALNKGEDRKKAFLSNLMDVFVKSFVLIRRTRELVKNK